jgi:hypothetical protein
MDDALSDNLLSLCFVVFMFHRQHLMTEPTTSSAAPSAFSVANLRTFFVFVLALSTAGA